MNRQVELLQECLAAERREHAPIGRHKQHCGDTHAWEDGNGLVRIVGTEAFYAELARKIFGEALPPDGADERGKALVETLNRILSFPLDICRVGEATREDGTRDGRPPLSHRVLPFIATRFLAMVWVVHPSLLGGISLRNLARVLDCKPANLAQHTGEFSRAFNLRTHAQAQGATKFNAKTRRLAEEGGQAAGGAAVSDQLAEDPPGEVPGSPDDGGGGSETEKRAAGVSPRRLADTFQERKFVKPAAPPADDDFFLKSVDTVFCEPRCHVGRENQVVIIQRQLPEVDWDRNECVLFLSESQAGRLRRKIGEALREMVKEDA